MKIGLATDHGGYELKEELKIKLKDIGYDIVDYGCYSSERTDHPVFAFKLCQGVISKEIDLGITICKTGIGMSIDCNKVKRIRCAKIDNEVDAKYAKCHNNANVLSFSGNKSVEEILNYLKIFTENEFLNDRYQLRIKMVEDYEDAH